MLRLPFFENRVPAPTFSHLGFIGDVIGDAIAVSFVAFATSYAMAKILAERDKEEVNANQVNLQIYSSLHIYLDSTFSLPHIDLIHIILLCKIALSNEYLLPINQSINQ